MHILFYILIAIVLFYVLFGVAITINYKRTPEHLKGVRKLNGHFQMPGTHK